MYVQPLIFRRFIHHYKTVVIIPCLSIISKLSASGVIAFNHFSAVQKVVKDVTTLSNIDRF